MGASADVSVREDLTAPIDPQEHLGTNRLDGLGRERPAGDAQPATAPGWSVARASTSHRAASVHTWLGRESAPIGLDLGHQSRSGSPAQSCREHAPCLIPSRLGNTREQHVLAPRPRRPGLVEVARRHRSDRPRVVRTLRFAGETRWGAMTLVKRGSPVRLRPSALDFCRFGTRWAVYRLSSPDLNCPPVEGATYRVSERKMALLGLLAPCSESLRAVLWPTELRRRNGCTVQRVGRSPSYRFGQGTVGSTVTISPLRNVSSTLPLKPPFGQVLGTVP